MTKDNEKIISFFTKNGLSPKRNHSILEIDGTVEDSLSSILFYTHPNQFLLSKYITDNELIEYGIEGAYGWLNEDGIFIPNISINSHLRNFNGSFEDYRIEDFDTIICKECSDSLMHLANWEYNQEVFLTCENLNYLKLLQEYLNCSNEYRELPQNYKMIIDEDIFGLIRTKENR